MVPPLECALLPLQQLSKKSGSFFSHSSPDGEITVFPCHLVHWVLINSRRECIFPPTADRASKFSLNQISLLPKHSECTRDSHSPESLWGFLCSPQSRQDSPTPSSHIHTSLHGSPNSMKKDMLSQSMGPPEPPSFPCYQKTSTDFPRNPKNLKQKQE